MENKSTLWRITWVHTAGYTAPHQVMEAEKSMKEDALRKKASEVAAQSRLSDFPGIWKWTLTREPELSKKGWKDRRRKLLNT